MRPDQYIAAKRLQTIFKEQGVTACSCKSTGPMECPEHVGAMIDYYEKNVAKKAADKKRGHR